MQRMLRGLGGLPIPRAVPAEVQSETELPRATPCTVLKHATGSGLCKTVDCGVCPYLAEALPEKAAWLCSNCARSYTTEGYYADGACSHCGAYSSVLALSFLVPV